MNTAASTLKVLIVSALYPPHVMGGAEDSAANLAEWLHAQAIETGVVRAVADGEEPGEERSAGGVHIWRIKTPHLYPIASFPSAVSWQKPLWHLQDHLDPRGQRQIGAILDSFRPDVVNVHMLQGIGYPALRETARRRIPVSYVLHDLGLACIRMSMFRNGRDCLTQCAMCRLSARYKAGLVARQSHIAFVSPSQANLDTLGRFFPVGSYPGAVILNTNRYPRPTRGHRPHDRLRLLFAGRLHSSKGVESLLQAVEIASASHPVSLAIAGSGPLQNALRARYEGQEWCRFLGFIPQAELADVMMDSDLLCVPSIWAENSPGVVIQALGLGLPVLANNRGGIPELVRHNANGWLVPEATVEAWRDAIVRIASTPADLGRWRAEAEAEKARFDQDHIGLQMLAHLRLVAFGGETNAAAQP